MVYEIECAQCGELIDFGGEEPDELPEDAVEFDGKVYCSDCVKEFVETGTGEITDRVENLENMMDEVADQLGIEKHLGQGGDG